MQNLRSFHRGDFNHQTYCTFDFLYKSVAYITEVVS